MPGSRIYPFLILEKVCHIPFPISDHYSHLEFKYFFYVLPQPSLEHLQR